MEKNKSSTSNNSTKKNNDNPSGKSSTAIEYTAGCSKHGMIQGITYQVKILTWVAWNLLRTHLDDKEWFLGTEVNNAIGFHDLVLKYKDKELNGHVKGNTPDKWMYRFVQIKHKLVVNKNTVITLSDLRSRERKNQYSLVYLFQSYLNMLGIFEKITPEQIRDMTVFTNAHIKEDIAFLKPVDSDKLFDFEGRGKRYRIDPDIFKNNSGIMKRLREIISNDAIIRDFLSKLIFAVDQPSEYEIEGLIIKEMNKVFKVPQILYNDLYKNITEWFLVYHNGKAPYLTLKLLMQYMQNTKSIIRQSKTNKSKDILMITKLCLATHI